jgi:hypothetical protein
MRARRPVLASVVGRSERGYRLELRGLYAALTSARHELAIGEEVEVRITRMDADEGRIFVSDRAAATLQPRLL